jgi:hypothetical protein
MKLIRSLSFRIAICLLPLAGALAAARAEGVLTVKTDPDGIEVWLGDKFLGQSPILDKKVKSGRYTLKLVDPAQHSSSSEDVFLQDGDTTIIDRTITTKFGCLKITSDPAGADAFISTELGKTPLSNEFMNPGRYRLEIRPSGSRYNPALTEITIAKGQVVSIDQKLEPRKFFTTKKWISLGFFAGTVGGFIWAIVEQNNYDVYKDRGESQGKIDGAGIQRTLGLILGSGCAIGLEITALF